MNVEKRLTEEQRELITRVLDDIVNERNFIGVLADVLDSLLEGFNIDAEERPEEMVVALGAIILGLAVNLKSQQSEQAAKDFKNTMKEIVDMELDRYPNTLSEYRFYWRSLGKLANTSSM